MTAKSPLPTSWPDSFPVPDSARTRRLQERRFSSLLGEAYFKSKEWKSARCPNEAVCSIISRLNEIVPIPGSVEYNSFQDEVSQYGMLLRSRIGLYRFSFGMIDPYERLERNLSPQVLYDRMCDLKIRIAELNCALGLPAALGEVEANLTVHSIFPQSPQGVPGDWKDTIGRINLLSEKAALGWIHELIERGSLRPELLGLKAPGL